MILAIVVIKMLETTIKSRSRIRYIYLSTTIVQAYRSGIDISFKAGSFRGHSKGLENLVQIICLYTELNRIAILTRSKTIFLPLNKRLIVTTGINRILRKIFLFKRSSVTRNIYISTYITTAKDNSSFRYW